MIFDPENPRMRLGLILVSGIVVILLIALFFPWASDFYHPSKPSAPASSQETTSASSPADSVIQLLTTFHPGQSATPSALKLAADFLEQAGDPRAVLPRQQLLRLQPWLPENHPEPVSTSPRGRAIAALRAKDLSTANTEADLLCASNQTTFRDHLLRAHIRLASHGTTLDETLSALEQHTLAHPAETADFTGWLIALGRITEARAWLARHAVSHSQLQETLAARADALAAAGYWDDARPLIAQGAWGHIPPDALQLALSARILDRQTRSQLQHDLWNEALRASASHLSGLQILNRLAVTWGWPAETAATLLVVIRNHPSATWAYAALADHHLANKDTANLKAIVTLWREAEPGRPDVEARWTRLSLLTESSALNTAAQAAAARLHAADPANPEAVFSIALARWQQGNAKEALGLMETLPGATRLHSGIALYHGLFLASLGRRSEARDALARVDESTLLREESALLQTVKIASREPKPVPPKAPKPTPKAALAPSVPPPSPSQSAPQNTARQQ